MSTPAPADQTDSQERSVPRGNGDQPASKFVLYIAISGAKTKVGITSNLRARFGQYCTHNPDIELKEKVGGLNEATARNLEHLVHRVLGAVGDEWVPRSEEQVDEAIECAKQFVVQISALYDKWRGQA
jgi:hypothetical protein